MKSIIAMQSSLMSTTWRRLLKAIQYQSSAIIQQCLHVFAPHFISEELVYSKRVTVVQSFSLVNNDNLQAIASDSSFQGRIYADHEFFTLDRIIHLHVACRLYVLGQGSSLIHMHLCSRPGYVYTPI